MPRDFQEIIKILPALTRKPARYDQWKADNGFVDIEDLPLPPPEDNVATGDAPFPSEEQRHASGPKPERRVEDPEDAPRRLHFLHLPVREVVSQIKRVK